MNTAHPGTPEVGILLLLQKGGNNPYHSRKENWMGGTQVYHKQSAPCKCSPYGMSTAGGGR